MVQTEKFIMKIVIKIIGVIILLQVDLLYAQDLNYPIPKTENILFYIQRNHNANTIVYDANFDADGNLNSEKPIDAYWLRYQEDGQRMELRSFERWMAYGIDCEVSEDTNYDYKAHLSASNKVVFWLRQIAPFKAEIYTDINGELVLLNHLFATLDESGWVPKVKYGEFFGEKSNGERAHKKVMPKDIK
jgi:hypothetical protein